MFCQIFNIADSSITNNWSGKWTKCNLDCPNVGPCIAPDQNNIYCETEPSSAGDKLVYVHIKQNGHNHPVNNRVKFTFDLEISSVNPSEGKLLYSTHGIIHTVLINT